MRTLLQVARHCHKGGVYSLVFGKNSSCGSEEELEEGKTRVGAPDTRRWGSGPGPGQ